MLDTRRLILAQTIFDRLVELPPQKRAASLDSSCRGDEELRTYLERLLIHDDSGMGGFLKIPLGSGECRMLGADEHVLPTEIGEYRIARRIGSGGMGVVYEAEQPNTRRRVALKVIRSDLINDRTLRRFQIEAELLAQLRHPGIAQIYEFGVGAMSVDGAPQARRPFFAMELIDGLPISEYTTNKNLTTVDTIELLARVCDGVHHAHQKGIIHRDLKPANIFVDAEGQPKILDFGVARAVGASSESLAAQTHTGQLLGTLAYMSPEQLAGSPQSVDTRSDVYSLGVIAYELLTRKLPVEIGGEPLPRAIRSLAERDAIPAGMVHPALRGDIEAILQKALEKNPDRRYGSAAELAADLRRFIRHEPVSARAPSAMYQFTRFTKRNRGLVGGFIAAILALVAGAIGTGTFAWRESRQADRAKAQASRAEAVVGFMENMLTSVDPNSVRGREVSVRQMLDEAAARLEAGELSNEPESCATLRRTIGRTYLHLNDYAPADRHLTASLELMRQLRGPRHDDIISTLQFVAAAKLGLAQFDEAERLDTEALEMSRELYGESHRSTAHALSQLGTCMGSAEKHVESAELQGQALKLRRNLPDITPEELTESLNSCGTALLHLARFDEAELLLREALDIRRKTLSRDHPKLVAAASNLGSLLLQRGRLAEAGELLEESLEIRRRTLEPTDPDLAFTLNSVARLWRAQNRSADAVTLYREAIQIQETEGRPPDPELGKTYLNLSTALYALGETVAGDGAGNKGLNVLRTVYGPRNLNVSIALNNLAAQKQLSGDAPGAEPMLREAHDILTELNLPNNHPVLSHVRDTLGVVLICMQKCAEAIAVLEKSLAARKETFGEKSDKVGLTLTHLSQARLRTGDFAAAESDALAAVEILRLDPGARAQMAVAMLTAGEAALSIDGAISDLVAIDQLTQEGLQIMEEERGNTSWQAADAHRVRAIWFMRANESELADQSLNTARSILDSASAASESDRARIAHLIIQTAAQFNSLRNGAAPDRANKVAAE